MVLYSGCWSDWSITPLFKYVARNIAFTLSNMTYPSVRTILHSQESRWLQTNEVSWAGFSVIYVEDID